MNIERKFSPITIVLQTQEEASFLMGLLGIAQVSPEPPFKFYSDLYSLLKKNGVVANENIDGEIVFKDNQ
jgi:hypothetical protein